MIQYFNVKSKVNVSFIFFLKGSDESHDDDRKSESKIQHKRLNVLTVPEPVNENRVILFSFFQQSLMEQQS